MNREIKFRIWQTCWDDKSLKKMHQVKSIDFEEEVYQVESSSVGYNFRDAFLMQYTGLTDKNGKEIYEGDILKIDDQEETTGEVVFYEGSFKLKEDLLFYAHLSAYNPKVMSEVIGNIYETKTN